MTEPKSKPDGFVCAKWREHLEEFNRLYIHKNAYSPFDTTGVYLITEQRHARMEALEEWAKKLLPRYNKMFNNYKIAFGGFCTQDDEKLLADYDALPPKEQP